MKTETPEKVEAPMKIVERSIDGQLTVKRTLVPADTKDDDIPMGSRLLNTLETSGRMNRSFEPEDFSKGDPVRDANDSLRRGQVTAMLKSGKIQVKWEDGKVDRYEAIELRKIY